MRSFSVPSKPSKFAEFIEISCSSMSGVLRKTRTAIQNPHLVLDRIVSVKRSLLLGSRAFQITRHFDFYFTPTSFHGDDRRSLLAGTYEADERRILKEFKQSEYILECGANIGVVSRYASRKLRRNGLYLVVEANPLSLVALRRNMKMTSLRRLGMKYKVLPTAVCSSCDDGKEIDFAVRPNLSSAIPQNNSTIAGYVELRRDENIIKIPARSLSSLIDEFVPSGQMVSVIMDIEGGEIEILKDPKAFDRVDQLAIELHGPEVTGRPIMPDELLQKFGEIGFMPRMIVGRSFLLRRVPA